MYTIFNFFFMFIKYVYVYYTYKTFIYVQYLLNKLNNLLFVSFPLFLYAIKIIIEILWTNYRKLLKLNSPKKYDSYRNTKKTE